MFSGARFCQPGRYPMFSTTQQQNIPILGGDALFAVSASFPTLHVDPDLNNSKCCGLNCWLMNHSTVFFSLCGQKRKNSGEEILATVPRLRAGPAWQASKNLLPARKGKQQAFSMLLVRRTGGNRPSVIIVLGSECCSS